MATSERASFAVSSGFAEIPGSTLWGRLDGRGDPRSGQLLLSFEQYGCGDV